MRPEIPVLILTANDSLANAIECIKLGAFHFVSKPYAAEELLSLMHRALQQRRLEAETLELRQRSAHLEERIRVIESNMAPIFGSRSMQQIEELLKRVAPSEANVLLLGESGVGKEVLANRVHEMSKRSKMPMVKLNCAAFPANMIESELFGYVRGAFTGAASDFPGMLAQANRGTLFLDEVAEMPAELQTRFLRVLQEREYRPLGSTKTLKTDFRLVAATNRPVAESVRQGVLRQDFYYRLNTFQIEIPPLRSRVEDVAPLARQFVSRFAAKQGISTPQISTDVMQRLSAYHWPGNIRELQNAMEYAVILMEDGIIEQRHLPAELRVTAGVHQALLDSPPSLSLAENEKQTILRALIETHGNKKRAAEMLGIQRPTLYGKLRQYGIHKGSGDTVA
jgi:DNA-binding NtrC family response regulator